MNSILNFDKIIQNMDTYSIDIKNKVNHGEVFTPFHIIEEMLDLLDEKDWSNPNLKWLDPANGIGNFTIIIIERLMNGLK
jgi:type I restriction-modification system DNA methylase subunit